jgi:hypothetical protein
MWNVLNRHSEALKVRDSLLLGASAKLCLGFFRGVSCLEERFTEGDSGGVSVAVSPLPKEILNELLD